MQELIWQTRPDLIIETGIAHGGSLIFSASLIAMLDMADSIESDTAVDAKASKRKVLGIDIDIRAQPGRNRSSSNVLSYPDDSGLQYCARNY